MIEKLREVELEYIRKFSKSKKLEYGVRFRDDKIKDMYSHNLTFVTKEVSTEKLIEMVNEEIAVRKNEDKDFLNMRYDFDINEDKIKDFPIEPEISIDYFMAINTSDYAKLGGNQDAVIKKADTDKVMQDGIEVDILANGEIMGHEFAIRRINRKKEVFNDPNSNLDFYVCYLGDTPVGNCEMLISGGVAKIEDFDILPEYQKKGLGTAVLKYLLRVALENGVKTAYVITDAEDTAKEMYSKCGFVKLGERPSLFFKL